MPIDRHRFFSPFQKHDAPEWPCPSCRTGVLHFDISTLSVKPSANPMLRRFVAMAICCNKGCKEAAAIFGESNFYHVDDSEKYYEFFSPKHFSPSPPLIKIPDNCSESVTTHIKLSFSNAWGNPTASSAHIRNAVERLLDQLRIKKTNLSKNGKRQKLTLHARIEKLSAYDPDASELLLAVKWLGNAGIHTGAISVDEVFDALEILEKALHMLLSEESKRIKSLAKKINRRKG